MARETDPKKRVVITGMGIVSVFGNDVDKFYDKVERSAALSPFFALPLPSPAGLE